MKDLIIFTIIFSLLASPLNLGALENNTAKAQEEITSTMYRENLQTAFEEVRAEIRDIRFMASPGAKPNGVISMDGYDASMLTSDDGYYGLAKWQEDNPDDEIIPDQYKNLPVYDIKTIRSVLNLVTPKSVGGEGTEWLKVKTLVRGYTSEQQGYSKENGVCDENSNECNVSPHKNDRGQAVDVSEKDFLKCTQVLIKQGETPTIQRDDSKAIAPMPIQFGYQSKDGQGGLGNGNGKGNNFGNIFNQILQNVTNGSFTFHGAIGQVAQNTGFQFVNQLISQSLGIDTDNFTFPDFHGGLASSAASTFNQAANDAMGLPNSAAFGYDFAQTVKNVGSSVLAGVFNNVLSDKSFTSASYSNDPNLNSLERWEVNIGKNTLEKQLLLPEGSISGENSQEITENIGRAKIGVALGVGSGLIGKNITGGDNFKVAVGQAYIEKYLNLAPDSFTSDDLGRVKSRVGEENFQARFSNNKQITAQILGFSNTNNLDQNLANPRELKKEVGEWVVNSNFGFYGTTAMSVGSTTFNLNSRDEAFDLVDYSKPHFYLAGQQPDEVSSSDTQYDSTKNNILVFDYSNPQQLYTVYPNIEINDAYKNNSRAYEQLLSQAQANGISNKILNGETDTNLFLRVGRDAISKSLSPTSSDDKEKAWIRTWLTTKNIPTDGNKPELDSTSLAGKVGLKPYDLERIFLTNRAEEVFLRLGRTAGLEQAINPSMAREATDNYIIENISNDETKNYFQSKIDQLKYYLVDNNPTGLDSASKAEISASISQIEGELNRTLDASEEKIAIIANRQRQKNIYYELYLIQGQINASSIEAETKRELNKTINEILLGRTIDSISNIPLNTKSNMALGVNKKDLQTFLKQDEGSLDIDAFVEKVGVAALSADTGELSNGNIIKALNYAKTNGPLSTRANHDYDANYIGEVTQLLDANNTFGSTAKILNASLLLPSGTISPTDMSQMLAGNQNVLMDKTVTLFAKIMQSNPQIMKDIFGGINLGTNLPSIPFDDLMGNVSGIMSSASQMKDIFGAQASPNHIADVLGQGVGYIGNIFGYFDASSNPEADNSEYQKFYTTVNDYFRKGSQTVESIQGLATIFGSNGWNVGSAMAAGNFLGTIKENGLLDWFKMGQEAYPDLDLGELKKWRIGEATRFLDNKTIGDWVGDIRNTFTITPNSAQEGEIINGASAILTGNFNRDTALNQVNIYLHNQVDENIPYGAVSGMFSGNPQAMGGTVMNYFQNYAASHHADPAVTGAIGTVGSALQNGNWAGVTDSARNYATNYVSGHWTEIFGSSVPEPLKAPLLSGLSSGNFSNLGANWQQIAGSSFGSWFDKVLDVPKETTFDIGNVFSGNPLSGLDPHNFDISNIGQGLANAGISMGISMVTSMLDPTFGDLEESLGLPQGFISGAVATIIPAILNPAYPLTSALFTYVLPLVFSNMNLGPLNSVFGAMGGSSGQKKTEVWCAMDYYPVLDDEATGNELVTYDVAFGDKPAETPYMLDTVAVHTDSANNLDQEKAKIGDNSGGAWKVHDNRTERKGEFLVKGKTGKNMPEKIAAAAKFKIAELIGELIRIHEKNKMDDWYMLPMQIKSLDSESFDPQYLYKLDELYGDYDVTESGQKEVVLNMVEYMQTGVRRGVFTEEYHLDNVHWGY